MLQAFFVCLIVRFERKNKHCKRACGVRAGVTLGGLERERRQGHLEVLFEYLIKLVSKKVIHTIA